MAPNKKIILQWNCQGLKSKRGELDYLISKHHPAVICLQETMLSPEIEKLQRNNQPLPSYLNIKGYTPYFKCRQTGRNGVAIYVRNKGTIHSTIKLSTVLQSLAIRLTVQGRNFIVCSHYSPCDPNRSPTKGQFQNLINHFKQPFLISLDANAHNTLWSSDHTDPAGRVLEEILQVNDLSLLNTTCPTRGKSVLDLTIAHSEIMLDFQSEVISSKHSSDHHPVLISFTSDLNETERIPRWNVKKADWSTFKYMSTAEITPELFLSEEEKGEDKMEVFTRKLIEIATDTIPQTSPHHQYKASKPWWDDECQDVKRERNQAVRLADDIPTVNNRIRAKYLIALTKRTFMKKKKESWRKYISKINSKTRPKHIWDMIRKISGKNVKAPLVHLKEGKQIITDEAKIAEKFGQTYQQKSSSANYCEEFKSIKDKAESNGLDFSTNKHFSYNKAFTLRDLKRSLKKAKDTSPGLDNIPYILLKQLPDSALKVLLDIINDYWTSHTFPDSWRTALLIPILKPDKDKHNPTSYRPISLTSCICKTMERMVNERLVHFLESKGLLSKYQAGYRARRGCVDQLVRLENFIKEAFLYKDHVVGVFYDLSKAYDTTWKYGIMKDLHDMGIRGNLAFFIQHFLSDRTFFILLNGKLHTDNTFIQEEGVPQGAILSTTLFNVKLNEIAEQLSDDANCSVYVDDFVIFMKSSTSDGIRRRLQLNINRIDDWAQRNGFTICREKTVAMHFCNCSRHYDEEGFCRDPVLYFDKVESEQNKIKYVKEKKFLGLYWDPQLTFEKHVDYLKNKCTNVLNLMRVLSHIHWGGDSRTLMKLYRSLIRSKLDYGSIVFMKAKKEVLRPLDVIHHAGLRLALGAFKSSPVESLYVEANELPLSLRRDELAMKYALRIKSNKSNPTYESLFNIVDHKEKYIEVKRNTDPNSKNPPKESSSLHLNTLFQEADINTKCIKPVKFPSFPAYLSEAVEVNFSLLAYNKKENNNAFLKSKFLELLPYYDGHYRIFTDGSKVDEVAAYGMHCDLGNLSTRLRNNSSIFTAELEGIHQALRFIRVSTMNRFVIFCDSKSVLESINLHLDNNPLVVEILDTIQNLLSNHRKVIKLCWVPSHVGITGNEQADLAANGARDGDEDTNRLIPSSDLIPLVRTFIRQKWQSRYESHHSRFPLKLKEITPIINTFHVLGLDRREEVVIHRIRIGHSRLTHGYLMEKKPNPPNCHFCNNSPISIRHILIECNNLNNTRIQYFNAANLEELFDQFSIKVILDYLREIQVYDNI